MPPTPIDLEPYRDEIKQWIDIGRSQTEIRYSLLAEHAVDVGKMTLTRRIAIWGLRTRRMQTTSAERQRLTDWIAAFLLRYPGVIDRQLAGILATEGLGDYHQATVGQLRRAAGIKKMVRSPAEIAAQEIITREQLIAEYNGGRIEDMGRSLLYSYMQQKYGTLGRDRTYRLAREIYPEGVANRLAKARIHKGLLKTPGPNYAWSMDGYCKLEHWGIQIYGIIDVYSRKLVSIYCGITGRTAVSVLAQYTATLAAGGVMPQILRSDHGGETPIAADAHYMLSNRLRPNEDGSNLRFYSTFRYGTSKQNQRIEVWWFHQSRTTMSRWRLLFIQLDRDGEYIKDNIADRIAFLAIYLPIVQAELKEFIHLWNDHCIRKQKNRPHVVYGIPSLMYNYPENLEGNQEPGQQCGIPVDPSELVDIQRDLEGFDMDEYLPPAMLQLCSEYLRPHDYVLPISGVSYEEATGEKHHLIAYTILRDHLRNHRQQGYMPRLSESSKPRNARDWVPSLPLREAFEDAGEDLVFIDEIGTDREMANIQQPYEDYHGVT